MDRKRKKDSNQIERRKKGKRRKVFGLRERGHGWQDEGTQMYFLI